MPTAAMPSPTARSTHLGNPTTLPGTTPQGFDDGLSSALAILPRAAEPVARFGGSRPVTACASLFVSSKRHAERK